MLTKGNYEAVYRKSIDEPERFWGEAAEAISWARRWDKVLDYSNKPFCRWFEGGRLNTCYNALDLHVQTGRADQAAIIHDSPVTGTMRIISYRELLSSVAKFAGVLEGFGLGKGDRVVIYMPMIPEAVVAMLGCARIGVVHSVVFGGFAPREFAKRISDAKPKLLVTASCGIEGKRLIPYEPLLDQAVRLSDHKPPPTVVFQRPEHASDLGKNAFDWDESMRGAREADCVPLSAADPLYILYTSGTTGAPKGVVRDNGGHAVALRWTMENFYDVRPGEVFWAASDVGWVVGHSYIVYAPLLTGCTTVMYEGKPVGTPDPGAFWRVISQHNVSALFTAPTALRAIKREDPEGKYLEKYDIACLRYLFLAGERLDPDTYHWARALIKKPVIDHWWQTETGWPIAGNCMGIQPLPMKAGSPTKPVPGYDVQVVDAYGKPVPALTEGLVVINLPLPPGCLSTLWNNDDKFLDYFAAFPNLYLTGDEGYFDEDGYLFVMGRADEVMNVAGHRLSPGTIEEIVTKHRAVAECAVVGVADQLKGQLPFGFLVLKTDAPYAEEEVVREVIRMVRDQLGAVACFSLCVVVESLPKTRSGKILRKTMSQIVDGKDYRIPSTIDDISTLKKIELAAASLKK